MGRARPALGTLMLLPRTPGSEPGQQPRSYDTDTPEAVAPLLQEVTGLPQPPLPTCSFLPAVLDHTGA